MAREEEATKGLVKRGYCRPKGSIPSHKRGCTTYACGGWEEDHDGGDREVETKSGAIQRVSSFMKAKNIYGACDCNGKRCGPSKGAYFFVKNIVCDAHTGSINHKGKDKEAMEIVGVVDE
jgi:hypothetical protein